MSQTTAIVIGLGGMGSSAAASLARRGVRVIGLERYWPTHDNGSSHGESRAFRLAYYSDPAHVPYAQESRMLWEKLERDTGFELLTPCDALITAPNGSPEITAATTVAENVGIPYEMLTAPEVTARWSTLTPEPDSVTFLDHSQGIIRPEATVSANLHLATAHGADLHFNTAVESWRSTGDGVVVETTQGRFAADHLVITPGPWANHLLAAPGIPLQVGRWVQVWVRPAADLRLFAADRHPRVTFEQAGTGRVASGFSLLPGQSLIKIAFIKGEGSSTIVDPDSFERHARGDEADRVIEFMSQIIPALSGRPGERSRACISVQTPDDNFVIGPHPDHANVTIGAAFSVHGFKFVPVVGEILADLALDGVSSRDIGVFSPTRFDLASYG